MPSRPRARARKRARGTRGLCKFARPELVCFVHPDDAGSIGRALNQLARPLMEGAGAEQLRLRFAEGSSAA